MGYNEEAAKKEALAVGYGGTVHYAVLPTSHDVDDFFESLLDMNTHKLKNNKLPLVPVFKDWAQRATFYDFAVAKQAELQQALKGLFKRQGKELRLELRAATHLVDTSWGGYFGTGVGARVRTKLTGTPSKSPRVYVFGHSSPGSKTLGTNASVTDVADLLDDMEMPDTSDVRVNACWSGSGVKLDQEVGDVREAFLSGLLLKISAVEKSFAAKLHKELRRRGFKGTTSGYIGTVDFGDQKVLLRSGRISRHYATTLKGDLVVRRKEARVTFEE